MLHVSSHKRPGFRAGQSRVRVTVPLEIMPFLEEHHAPAAALLAARYRADQGRVSGLPAAYGDEVVALQAIQRLCAFPDADGWTALDGGEVAGYLIGKRLV